MSHKTLKQVYEDCVLFAKCTPPTVVQKGRLYKWRGNVDSCFMVGELNFTCGPYFGMTVSDATIILPCIINYPSSKSLSQLLTKCGRTLLFRNPEFVVEIVITDSCKEFSLVHFLLETDKIVPTSPVQLAKMDNSEAPLHELHNTKKETNHIVYFIPLKVSSLILTLKSEIFCLALVRLFNEEDNEDGAGKEVWLIFKNSQALYAPFFLPNSQYKIRFSNSSLPVDYFKKYESFSNIASQNLDLSFQQMLHHKELVKTNAAIIIPECSRIAMICSSLDHIFLPTDWFSVTDERIKLFQFVSVFGIISRVQYSECWNMLNCLWCGANSYTENLKLEKKRRKSDSDSNNDSDMKIRKTAANTCVENEIWFPYVTCDDKLKSGEKMDGFGIRGGKIDVQISIQDLSSSRNVHLFLKRWKQEQYPVSLIAGTAVCFTDVHVKHSEKNNTYFIGTPLTRVIHLNLSNDLWTNHIKKCDTELFGFPNIQSKNDKVWGILDLDFLGKVSVSAICKLCSQSYIRFRCSNIFCPNSKTNSDAGYNIKAVARLFVKGMENWNGCSLFLKNGNVQKYLGLSDNVWKIVCSLSTNCELIYSFPKVETTSPDNNEFLQLLFHTYCKHRRVTSRFHVYCKKFKGSSHDERKYYCTHLEAISGKRLEVTRSVLYNEWQDKM